MQIVADPNQLRYTASLFSNGANELRQKSKRIEDILNGLIQGQHSWKGEAAKGFSTQMEKIQNELQQKAGVLEEAAQILNQFAQQMDHVNQIRNQAMNLERTLWSIRGDSESVMHERQSISYQINQLQQEAEWQANAADAQATSALNSLSIPMPDLNITIGAPKAPVNEPWYDRVVDWFKEQGHEFAVAYEKHWTTGNIWYDELNYWTLGLPDKVEKVFHTKPFSLENLEANLDLFISVVPATKAESAALDGVKVASNAAEEKIIEQEAIDGGNHFGELLNKSSCNSDELQGYLEKLDKNNGTNYADDFSLSGKWPDEIQIPKGPNVLNADGSIKWSEVPNGGYLLDENGNAIKDIFVPKVGEIIDRYGPPNGRYTSPVLNGKPYSYEQRSLPYVEDATKYHQYEVIGDFSRLKEYVSKCKDVELKMKIEAQVERYYNGDYSKVVTYRGEIAAGFESPGGGIQYELPLPVDWLEKLGMLKQIN